MTELIYETDDYKYAYRTRLCQLTVLSKSIQRDGEIEYRLATRDQFLHAVCSIPEYWPAEFIAIKRKFLIGKEKTR